MSHRRGKTIGSAKTSAQIKKKVKQPQIFLGTRTVAMFPCYDCNQCPFVLKGKDFVHPTTGYTVHLQNNFTCISKYAIYALVCPCGLIYIGETTQMIKSRILQHRSSINLDQLKFMVLETVPPMKGGGDRELRLKQREVWWIHKLQALSPRGLNKDYDLYLFL
ncbi:hypothetical protein XELAEV_18015679mg [Xenopus laevis]|uniref:GIY-YIG domain-containing protein n=1 Tax=Xenopus laevis TaxID=8355 RepID=A0A974DL03_XENLA|nr:hypothetical protein XELAEV_18015679mg [Xenopus laevis]